MNHEPAPTRAVEVRRSTELSPEEAAWVRRLVSDVARAEGQSPMSEQSLLALSRSSPQQSHLLVTRHGALIGYAFRTSSPNSGPDSNDLAEIVVHPQSRDSGVGQRILRTLVDQPGSAQLTTWAHGRDSAIRRWAADLGFTPIRHLLQLRRSLTQLPPPADPAGVRIRPLRPGRDDDAVIAINRAAFRHIPDQAAWGLNDLRDRYRQSWFDAARCPVAQSATASTPPDLLGFHLTKVEPDEPTLGEIYALAVRPDQAGRGIGRSLALVGMQQLHRAGCGVVRLYVDGGNRPAVALYRRLGFEVWDEDVLLQQPAVSPPVDPL